MLQFAYVRPLLAKSRVTFTTLRNFKQTRLISQQRSSSSSSSSANDDGIQAANASMLSSLHTAAFHSTSSHNTFSVPDLHVLFCGSDEFSATSLDALVHARDTGTLPIRSLNVICRPPKRVGTGLKRVREVPIVATAQQHGLVVHKIDTFRGWEIPAPDSVFLPSDSSSIDAATKDTDRKFNLIVAVSFGLLIPARIISSVRYGGLNVHPSLLPDFRGAAPIEWSLLEGCTQTGVSLQTLHPTRFDHGALLMQQHADITSQDVTDTKMQLAAIGAEMLVEGLRKGKFLPQESDRGIATEPTGVEPFATYLDGVSPVLQRKAPKINPEHRHIQWTEWTAEQIMRRYKVLGSLWSDCVLEGKDATSSRIKRSAGFTVVENDKALELHHRQAGDLFYHRKALHVVSSDGKALRADACTLAGKPERKAHEAAQILFAKNSLLKLS